MLPGPDEHRLDIFITSQVTENQGCPNDVGPNTKNECEFFFGHRFRRLPVCRTGTDIWPLRRSFRELWEASRTRPSATAGGSGWRPKWTTCGRSRLVRWCL